MTSEATSQATDRLPPSMAAENSPRVSRCWLLYLLVAISAAMQLARICQVESKTGEVPFHSANDRSRWCTIAALGATGSYEIDDLLFDESSKRGRSHWHTIDLVRHRGADGKLHYYSSKPTLLPTLYAGVYWGILQLTGWSLTQETFFVARIMLVLVNLVPLTVFWVFWIRWFHGPSDDHDDWSASVGVVFLVFATFLSCFASTLNNHLPAAISVGITLFCLNEVLIRKDHRWRWFVIAGLAASFGAANDLPALAWCAAVGAMLLIVRPSKALLGFVPALLPVAAGFFGTNFIAHGDWKPAYAHRNLGATITVLEIQPGTTLVRPSDIAAAIRAEGIECSNDCELSEARRPGILRFFDQSNERQFALRMAEDESSLTIYEWGDWYDYPGSYWAGEKSGVDKGEASRAAYIFHCLLGHHGLFSLTPFWFVSVFGAVVVLFDRQSVPFWRDTRLLLGLAIIATTCVVLAFYFARGLEDRNYGGVSSGFRWTFWLIPLWIWLALQGLSKVRNSAARRTIEITVAFSAFSASFPWRNPWTSPWIMQLGEYFGWLVVG